MKRLFLSTAALALVLGAPSAFAGPHDHDKDKGGDHAQHAGPANPGPAAPAPGKAPHAGHHEFAPKAAAAPDQRRGNRGGMATTTASPAAGMTSPNNNNHFNFKDVGRAAAGQNANRPNNSRPDANGHNTRGRDNNRPDNNGPGNRNGNGDRGHANNNAQGHSHADFNRRNVRAQHHYHYRGGAYQGPRGYSYRRFTFGDFLPSIYFASNYYIDDYSSYGLQYPPPGTVWVRYGDDALLIDRYTGEILETVYDQFY